MGARTPDGPKQSEKRTRKAAPWQLGCKITMGRGRSRVVRNGTAALGPDELRFHTGRTGRDGPDFFLHVPYGEIQAVAVDVPAGILTVTTAEHGPVDFFLGRAAPDWKKRIEERPSRLDDLDIEATSRVAVVGLVDDELESELAARVASYQAGVDPGEGGLDILIVGAEHAADLARLPVLARRVRKPGGLVWVIFPAGSRHLTERTIVDAAPAAGLAPGAAVDLSRTHRALRLTS